MIRGLRVLKRLEVGREKGIEQRFRDIGIWVKLPLKKTLKRQ